MYLLILDWTDNSIEVVRNIPENLWDEENEEPDEGAIMDFLWEKCHRFIDDIQWKIVSEDDALIFATYREDGTVSTDAVDLFGQHF